MILLAASHLHANQHRPSSSSCLYGCEMSYLYALCRICVLGVLLGVVDFEPSAEVEGQGQGESEGHSDDDCGVELYRITLGFLVTLCVTLALEVAVAVVSMRGSILNVQPRAVMPYLLYARLRTFSCNLRTRVIRINGTKKFVAAVLL